MSSKIKLKKLEEYLQSIDAFERPKILLEQYLTPSHIASQLLFTIQNNYDDLDGKIVADLGCGTGMLSIGSAILGANHVIGFEIDEDAIEIATNNVNEMEIPNVDFINCNILKEVENERWQRCFDTVIMNPPFGTKKNSGMDLKFLECGIRVTSNVVYSLHKTSTREFLKKKIKEFENVDGEVIAELRYNLESSYKFHKKSSVDIEVDVWKINKK
jgi:rRNA N6-adenosine-methyltransferase METTL5